MAVKWLISIEFRRAQREPIVTVGLFITMDEETQLDKYEMYVGVDKITLSRE